MRDRWNSEAETEEEAMKLKGIMAKDVECVRPGDTLQDAARKMKDLDVGPMPGCGDNDKVVGMLTDRDIAIRAVAEGKDPRTTKVQDAMTEGVAWCFEDQDYEEAAELMQERQIRRLLVMNRDKRLVGIVSLGDMATEGRKKQAAETLQAVSEPSRLRRRRGRPGNRSVTRDACLRGRDKWPDPFVTGRRRGGCWPGNPRRAT
jgi:CBS domain-containing protein